MDASKQESETGEGEAKSERSFVREHGLGRAP